MFCNGIPLTPRRLRQTTNFVLAIFTAILFMLACTDSSAQTAPKRIPGQLIDAYSRVTEDYYHDLNLAQANRLTLTNVKTLYRQVERSDNQHNYKSSVSLILANTSLINNNIDSEYSAYFVRILLKNGLTSSGKQIANYAIENGNFETGSKMHYELASHYFNQNNLDLATKHLTSIEEREALTEKQQDYATLIFGVSFQRNKKHREAINIYNKIEKPSYYYSYAQLNSAIANIRQGWWTDAHIAIENALATEIPSELGEISNRLLVVLAYSQIQNEFYRNARKTFGKVSLDSVYVDKALLGMGLCALNQKDYIGAINAFSRLKQRSNDDALSVMEAYLLVPYSYDRMGEIDKAAEGYADAISFFESKIFLLDAQLLSLTQTGSIPLSPLLKQALPKNIVHMKERLDALDESANTKIADQIKSVKSQVNSDIAHKLKRIIQEKNGSIKSYISQSQYGLAKLYDNQ